MDKNMELTQNINELHEDLDNFKDEIYEELEKFLTL